MNNKCALITGITGQDGSYLAEFLLDKGYKIYGMVRRSSTVERKRIEHIYSFSHARETSFLLEYGDLNKHKNHHRN